jgi:hypothetical protein
MVKFKRPAIQKISAGLNRNGFSLLVDSYKNHPGGANNYFGLFFQVGAACFHP